MRFKTKHLHKIFPIGTWVAWTHTYQRRVSYSKGSPVYAHKQRSVAKNEPSTGVVVGMRWKRSGAIIEGDGLDEPRHFEANKGGSLCVLLVKTHYTGREIEVLWQATHLIHDTRIPEDGLETFRGERKASEEMKTIYRDEPDTFPRNKAGKFITYHASKQKDKV